jgi:hypothetical protein
MPRILENNEKCHNTPASETQERTMSVQLNDLRLLCSVLRFQGKIMTGKATGVRRGSAAHQRADLFTLKRTEQGLGIPQVEDQDGQLVVHAQ